MRPFWKTPATATSQAAQDALADALRYFLHQVVERQDMAYLTKEVLRGINEATDISVTIPLKLDVGFMEFARALLAAYEKYPKDAVGANATEPPQ